MICQYTRNGARICVPGIERVTSGRKREALLAQADCRMVFGDNWERLPCGGVPVLAELLGTAWREADNHLM